MIKSMKSVKKEEEGVVKYPRLMVHVIGDPEEYFTVLEVSEGKGFVVWAGEKTVRRLGEYRTDWSIVSNPKHWEKETKDITLSNN